MSRKLIVNADDFGFNAEVNAGIVEAHRRGILTATTLMANGDAFEDAVRLARETPALDVGCHLVLVGGRSVLPPHRRLPGSVAELVRAVSLGRLAIRDELAAQVRKITAAGLEPTHLDTHKHTHLLPPILEAVALVAEEFGIRWVRRPIDFPLNGKPESWAKRALSRGFRTLRRRFHKALERRGCRTTDHFAGFELTGSLRTAELLRLLGQLPDGLTELMCHPGFCGPELRAARTRLKESRQRELEALVAPETRAAIEAHGIELARYRDL